MIEYSLIKSVYSIMLTNKFLPLLIRKKKTIPQSCVCVGTSAQKAIHPEV